MWNFFQKTRKLSNALDKYFRAVRNFFINLKTKQFFTTGILFKRLKVNKIPTVLLTGLALAEINFHGRLKFDWKLYEIFGCYF